MELWDVSGVQKYDGCCPAVMQGLSTSHKSSSDDPPTVDGVVLVFNPDQPTHATESTLWYDTFVSGQQIPDSNVLVFVHRSDGKIGMRIRPPPKLEGCNCVQTTFDSAVEVREAFQKFIGGLGLNDSAGSSPFRNNRK